VRTLERDALAVNADTRSEGGKPDGLPRLRTATPTHSVVAARSLDRVYSLTPADPRPYRKPGHMRASARLVREARRDRHLSFVGVRDTERNRLGDGGMARPVAR
jgi:hypothetical protein